MEGDQSWELLLLGATENVKATSGPQAWAAPSRLLFWDSKVSGDAEPAQQQWSGVGKITRLTAWAWADIWVSRSLGSANYSTAKSDFATLGFYGLLWGCHFHVTS